MNGLPSMPAVYCCRTGRVPSDETSIPRPRGRGRERREGWGGEKGAGRGRESRKRRTRGLRVGESVGESRDPEALHPLPPQAQ